MSEMKGSQRRAQLGVSSQSALREEWRFFCLSFALHSFVSPRSSGPKYVSGLLHVVPWFAPPCPLLGTWSYSFCVTFFFFYFFLVGYRQLCCVDVCEYAFSFSAQIYLLEEKHICIKKLQNTGRMSTLFFFL